MINKHPFLVNAMLTLLVAYHTVAVCNETDPAASLFDLTLHDLANIHVSVATKTQEGLTHTPSSVTVFSYQQLVYVGIKAWKTC